MSNIFTTFVRIYARAPHRIDDEEAQRITWMVLGSRGSYHVPVWTRRGPDGSFVDVQYGSGKSGGPVELCDRYLETSDYGMVVGRTFDDGGDEDVIWRDHYRDGEDGLCRYGFDEVRVRYEGAVPQAASDAPWQREAGNLWRLPVSGSYRAGNARTVLGCDPWPASTPPDPDPPLSGEPLDTPTTPTSSGTPLIAVDPPWLASLADDVPGIRLIEYSWRGRVVHRTFRNAEATSGIGWWNRCADDWDNCLDAVFLRNTGQAHLLLAPELYERDRHDWEARMAGS